MKKETKKDPRDLFIPGGLFVGMGVGFIIHNLVGGLFVGLGIGFILTAFLKLSKRK